MKDSRHVWAWVGVVVVVAIIATWFVWALAPGGTAPKPVFAPQGQTVAQFPTALIIGTNATVAGSYSIDFSTSTDQYSASFNASSSMKTLYGDYQSYFTKNGWTVTNSISNQPSLAMIVARDSVGQAQVTIVSEGSNKSRVDVTYLTE